MAAHLLGDCDDDSGVGGAVLRFEHLGRRLLNSDHPDERCDGLIIVPRTAVSAIELQDACRRVC
jgi:hypothetical protein